MNTVISQIKDHFQLYKDSHIIASTMQELIHKSILNITEQNPDTEGPIFDIPDLIANRLIHTLQGMLWDVSWKLTNNHLVKMVIETELPTFMLQWTSLEDNETYLILLSYYGFGNIVNVAQFKSTSENKIIRENKNLVTTETIICFLMQYWTDIKARSQSLESGVIKQIKPELLLEFLLKCKNQSNKTKEPEDPSMN